MRRALILAPLFAGFAGPALAHPGAMHAAGFVQGLGHPLSGADHVLAMTAVGLFAAALGGRALWLAPAAFLAMMAAGAAIGATGGAVPFAEWGVAGSVVVLGLLIAARTRMPTAAAMAMVGAFAVFHGYAHGAEMPGTASGLLYGAGFLVSTALLLAAGAGLGRLAARMHGEAQPLAVRLTGGAVALAGVALLAGAI